MRFGNKKPFKKNTFLTLLNQSFDFVFLIDFNFCNKTYKKHVFTDKNIIMYKFKKKPKVVKHFIRQKVLNNFENCVISKNANINYISQKLIPTVIYRRLLAYTKRASLNVRISYNICIRF